ncbi:MAG: DUF1952 domain-containing protein [Anaerolineae bacterium]|nr:DUF1952 domain-containing protein [Anaerolineae bacterium]
MKKYLADLGAAETAENVMIGQGWQAVVRKSEPARIGSLVVGRIELELTGEPLAVDDLVERLHWKTMRGGG